MFWYVFPWINLPRCIFYVILGNFLPQTMKNAGLPGLLIQSHTMCFYTNVVKCFPLPCFSSSLCIWHDFRRVCHQNHENGKGFWGFTTWHLPAIFHGPQARGHKYWGCNTPKILTKIEKWFFCPLNFDLPSICPHPPNFVNRRRYW